MYLQRKKKKHQQQKVQQKAHNINRNENKENSNRIKSSASMLEESSVNHRSSSSTITATTTFHRPKMIMKRKRRRRRMERLNQEQISPSSEAYLSFFVLVNPSSSKRPSVLQQQVLSKDHTHLRVVGRNISVIDALPNDISHQIHSLFLSDNALTHCRGVEQFLHLETLSLANNRLTTLRDIEPLAALYNLKNLLLEGNPVVGMPAYRMYVIDLCSDRLKILDQRGIMPSEREGSQGIRKEVQHFFDQGVRYLWEIALLEHMKRLLLVHGEFLKRGYLRSRDDDDDDDDDEKSSPQDSLLRILRRRESNAAQEDEEDKGAHMYRMMLERECWLIFRDAQKRKRGGEEGMWLWVLKKILEGQEELRHCLGSQILKILEKKNNNDRSRSQQQQQQQPSGEKVAVSSRPPCRQDLLHHHRTYTTLLRKKSRHHQSGFRHDEEVRPHTQATMLHNRDISASSSSSSSSSSEDGTSPGLYHLLPADEMDSSSSVVVSLTVDSFPFPPPQRSGLMRSSSSRPSEMDEESTLILIQEKEDEGKRRDDAISAPAETSETSAIVSDEVDRSRPYPLALGEEDFKLYESLMKLRPLASSNTVVASSSTPDTTSTMSTARTIKRLQEQVVCLYDEAVRQSQQEGEMQKLHDLLKERIVTARRKKMQEMWRMNSVLEARRKESALLTMELRGLEERKLQMLEMQAEIEDGLREIQDIRGEEAMMLKIQRSIGEMEMKKKQRVQECLELHQQLHQVKSQKKEIMLMMTSSSSNSNVYREAVGCAKADTFRRQWAFRSSSSTQGLRGFFHLLRRRKGRHHYRIHGYYRQKVLEGYLCRWQRWIQQQQQQRRQSVFHRMIELRETENENGARQEECCWVKKESGRRRYSRGEGSWVEERLLQWRAARALTQWRSYTHVSKQRTLFRRKIQRKKKLREYFARWQEHHRKVVYTSEEDYERASFKATTQWQRIVLQRWSRRARQISREKDASTRALKKLLLRRFFLAWKYQASVARLMQRIELKFPVVESLLNVWGKFHWERKSESLEHWYRWCSNRSFHRDVVIPHLTRYNRQRMLRSGLGRWCCNLTTQTFKEEDEMIRVWSHRREKSQRRKAFIRWVRVARQRRLQRLTIDRLERFIQRKRLRMALQHLRKDTVEATSAATRPQERTGLPSQRLTPSLANLFRRQYQNSLIHWQQRRMRQQQHLGGGGVPVHEHGERRLRRYLAKDVPKRVEQALLHTDDEEDCTSISITDKENKEQIHNIRKLYVNLRSLDELLASKQAEIMREKDLQKESGASPVSRAEERKYQRQKEKKAMLKQIVAAQERLSGLKSERHATEEMKSILKVTLKEEKQKRRINNKDDQSKSNSLGNLLARAEEYQREYDRLCKESEELMQEKIELDQKLQSCLSILEKVHVQVDRETKMLEDLDQELIVLRRNLSPSLLCQSEEVSEGKLLDLKANGKETEDEGKDSLHALSDMQTDIHRLEERIKERFAQIPSF